MTTKNKNKRKEITNEVVSKSYLIVRKDTQMLLLELGTKAVPRSGPVCYGGPPGPAPHTFCAYKLVDKGEEIKVYEETPQTERIEVFHEDRNYSVYTYDRKTGKLEGLHKSIQAEKQLKDGRVLIQKDGDWYLGKVDRETFLGEDIGHGLYRQAANFGKYSLKNGQNTDITPFFDLYNGAEISFLDEVDKGEIVRNRYRDFWIDGDYAFGRREGRNFDLFFRGIMCNSLEASVNLYGAPIAFRYDWDKHCHIWTRLGGLDLENGVSYLEIDKGAYRIAVPGGLLLDSLFFDRKEKKIKPMAEAFEEERKVGEILVYKLRDQWFDQSGECLGRAIQGNGFLRLNDKTYHLTYFMKGERFKSDYAEIFVAQDENDEKILVAEEEGGLIKVFHLETKERAEKAPAQKLVTFEKDGKKQTFRLVLDEEQKAYRKS